MDDYKPTFQGLEDRVAANLQSLLELNIDEEPSEEEKDFARHVFTGEEKATETALAIPGVSMHLAYLLDQYDHQVVQSAAQMRTYITNRLMIESDNPDPRIRLKALEMLGKISDVGLFTDKTEVTLRHRPTAELEQMLRERLTKVITEEGEVQSPLEGHL